MNKKNKQAGFLTTIIIIIIAIIALKFIFQIDFKELLRSKIITDILDTLKKLLLLVWQVILNIVDFFTMLVDKIRIFFSKK